ncbi:hypothetical protein C8Q74DRAFT_1366174 [Fomes fomentarius]|nr:hypothetical protein C8Q74DRAFT_1366161 [Fomes fomentarius]KAI0794792.1 hypothetical protein C8Q74DRAFT_1366174 [Fomes fomentarius]
MKTRCFFGTRRVVRKICPPYVEKESRTRKSSFSDGSDEEIYGGSSPMALAQRSIVAYYSLHDTSISSDSDSDSDDLILNNAGKGGVNGSKGTSRQDKRARSRPITPPPALVVHIGIWTEAELEAFEKTSYSYESAISSISIFVTYADPCSD